MADESLREYAPKSMLESICHMLGFEAREVTEIRVYPREIEVDWASSGTPYPWPTGTTRIPVR